LDPHTVITFINFIVVIELLHYTITADTDVVSAWLVGANAAGLQVLQKYFVISDAD